MRSQQRTFAVWRTTSSKGLSIGAAGLALALSACSASVDGEPTVRRSQSWLCEATAELLTCGAAVRVAPGEEAAYACAPSATGNGCPPPTAASDDLTLVDPLVIDALDTMPWACLITGDYQRECMKDIRRAERIVNPDLAVQGDLPPLFAAGGATPAGAPGSSPAQADGAAVPAEGEMEAPYGSAPSQPSEAPEVVVAIFPRTPADCSNAAWENYFCELATYSYRDAGVDIQFPCTIFDASEPFTGPSPERDFSATTVSCATGEGQMRSAAWLEAVSTGCTDLSTEILTLCQQAADFAPVSGACSATGTW